ECISRTDPAAVLTDCTGDPPRVPTDHALGSRIFVLAEDQENTRASIKPSSREGHTESLARHRRTNKVPPGARRRRTTRSSLPSHRTSHQGDRLCPSLVARTHLSRFRTGIHRPVNFLANFSNCPDVVPVFSVHMLRLRL